MINMKYVKLFLVLVIGLGFMMGCVPDEEEEAEIPPKSFSSTTPDDDTPDPSPVAPKSPAVMAKKEFYGNWVYIESGESEKIDKNFEFPIKRLGQNFVEITKDEQKYMLLRDGSNSGVVRGKLYTDIEYVQKIYKETGEKIKKIKPIFHKESKIVYKVTINDGFFKQTRVVSANGEFSFSGVVIGRSKITIGKIDVGDIEEVLDGEEDVLVEDSNGIEDETQDIDSSQDEESDPHKEQEVFNDIVPIKEEDTDLGNFSIPDKNDKYNFKTSKVIDTQDKDDRYMYEGRTFKGKLYFKNTGKEMASGLNYEINTDDPYVEDLTYDIVMGSVEAGASIEIPFEITFGRLDKIAHRVKLNLIIRDAHKKEWLDNVYLDVYQTPITVNLKTKTSNLKGYFITPEHEIINIDTTDIKVKIPSRPDSYYYFLVTSPKEIGAETAYSMGIDINATEFADFHDTSAFEPNNIEEKATTLSVGDSIKSFIHKGDIDFYTIDFQENLSFEPPRLPFN